MMKPLIGITVNYLEDDQVGIVAKIGAKDQYWQALANDYIQAIEQAGGLPILIPVLKNNDESLEYLNYLDGILFSGGGDIDAKHYGEVHQGDFNELRDNQELKLVQEAIKRVDIPVLGICRGFQLMNVAMGGSLYFDIDTAKYGNHFFPEKKMNEFSHMINIEEGTLIKKILNDENSVNSYHHQGIKKLGDNLKITATSNGLAECIEMPERPGFTLAVQWHPEGLVNNSLGHDNIFKAFVDLTDNYRIKK